VFNPLSAFGEAGLAGRTIRIGVVAPACRIEPALAKDIQVLADRLYPDNPPALVFHPQCYASEGHFAGPDALRAAAFLEVANDPAYDALWVARGGYGSGRLIETVLPQLTDAARDKAYLGYSDAGAILAALYGAGVPGAAHGPMPQDLRRTGGEAAVARALAWLMRRDGAALEPSVIGGPPTAAFNLAILSALVGTPWLPDLSGHVLMLEEVSEPMYRIDRMLMQVTSNPNVRTAAGVRLGRCSAIPPNDPDFVLEEEAVTRFWCDRAGLPYLGRADIGHDVDNRVVPFGRA
jgi:muramoyltetrapeptide carboxypeptidase